jgi:hypothetical protein
LCTRTEARQLQRKRNLIGKARHLDRRVDIEDLAPGIPARNHGEGFDGNRGAATPLEAQRQLMRAVGEILLHFAPHEGAVEGACVREYGRDPFAGVTRDIDRERAPRHLRRRVGIGERTSNGPARTGRSMTDERHGLSEQGHRRADERVAFEDALAGDGADREPVALMTHETQIGDAGDVDQPFRPGEPHGHERDEALARQVGRAMMRRLERVRCTLLRDPGCAVVDLKRQSEVEERMGSHRLEITAGRVGACSPMMPSRPIFFTTIFSSRRTSSMH